MSFIKSNLFLVVVNKTHVQQALYGLIVYQTLLAMHFTFFCFFSPTISSPSNSSMLKAFINCAYLSIKNKLCIMIVTGRKHALFFELH